MNMAYYEGFVVPVPKANREEYRKHAAEAAPMFRDLGVVRHVEAWASDVPEGKVTDFRKAVDAKEDEDVVFAWFEYPDKAARVAANERMMSDPRMQEMGATMPFDGKRMIMGGFKGIVEEGSSSGGYTDGFVVPVPESNREAYRDLAAKMATVFQERGANRVVEAIADDVSHGQVTDFYRAVKAEDGETVVFSFIEWPDKATRDAAWKTMMENDPAPSDPMPFDGKRMFWGGFDPILDTQKAKSPANA
jgi:uncharacterized protein YbaA (DUF1428 family)